MLMTYVWFSKYTLTIYINKSEIISNYLEDIVNDFGLEFSAPKFSGPVLMTEGHPSFNVQPSTSHTSNLISRNRR